MTRRNRHRGKPPAARVATVSIRVRDLAQMFNSLDPSPFWDRDLDSKAADFIEEEFNDKRSAGEWHLHVHASEGAALAADLQPAIEHHYERMATSARHRMREHLWFGQLALVGGIAIFLASMTVRSLLSGLLAGGTPRMLDEGLIILAWLALWRPAEALVYGWIPDWRSSRTYERLAAIRVFVRFETSLAGTPPAQHGEAGQPQAGAHRP